MPMQSTTTMSDTRHPHHPSTSKRPIDVRVFRDELGYSLRSSGARGLELYRVWEVELADEESVTVDLVVGGSTLEVQYTKNEYTAAGVECTGTELVLRAVKVQYEVELVDPVQPSLATLIRVKSKGLGDEVLGGD